MADYISAYTGAQIDLAIGTISTSNPSMRNRIINGGMVIAPNTSATITAGTAVPTTPPTYPVASKFFIYSVGGNPTVAQIAGTGSVNNRLQITGVGGVTSVGVGQRISHNDSCDLAGTTCVLSMAMSNSILSSVSWSVSYAGTIDTFGTIGTPTKTVIASGTFTVTSTISNYSVQITVPTVATTGIEVLLTVGAQNAGLWTIGNVQFEKGLSASSFDARPYTTEALLCGLIIPTSDLLPVVVRNAGDTATVFTLRSQGVQGSYSNLTVSTTGTSVVTTVTADYVALRNSDGDFIVPSSVNLPISATTAGANGLDTGSIAYSTWYYVFVIAKPDGTVAGLLSLSGTAPTLPATYTYFARVGSIRIQAATNYYPLPTLQKGQSARYVPKAGTSLTSYPGLTSGAIASTVSIVGSIPPTAVQVLIRLSSWQQSNGIISIGASSVDTIALIQANSNNLVAQIVPILLETTSIYVNGQTYTATGVYGWEDNL